MTNADRFQQVFGLFATEVWAFSEKDFLNWLNEEPPELTVKAITKCGKCVKWDDDNEVCKKLKTVMFADDYCSMATRRKG